ncbi:MAG: TonB-dependent receptor plug domain-containing protein [Paludibacteraceae bacterium]|nr:TonB-dependent receptor plug domain-containing protein [Paludibacteraceae bacterium]
MIFLLHFILFLIPIDTTALQLSEVVVLQHKGTDSDSPRQQARQVTILTPADLNALQVIAPKDFAAQIPNLVMPDYGSAMTSSVYVRGMGARLDQPVIGITLDGIPLLDKNTYDQSLLNLTNAAFFAGPQGTLYGRNTMGGLLALQTRQPLDVEGKAGSVSLTYGSANSIRAQAAIYQNIDNRFGWSLTGSYDRTDGFYTNRYTGDRVDRGQNGTIRLQLQYRPDNKWILYHTTAANYTSQGAFPYADERTGEIAFNSPASYRRFNLQESLRAVWKEDRRQVEMMATYQLLNDRMRMDQDYTPLSYFTLEQRQLQQAAMADAVWTERPQADWYRFSLGTAAFLKHNTMNAPVHFMQDGIDSLILKNANNGIRNIFPADSLEIAESTIPMNSNFLLLNASGAIYHQSEFIPIPRLHITAGLRLDLEHTDMDYDASSLLHYRMTAMMTRMRAFEIGMKGHIDHTYFQVLPRLDIRYDWDNVTIYAYGARGTKAGGYNPQIFSTILQNRMMTDLMADMGVHMDNTTDPRYTRPDITEYRPESAWTGEIGLHALLYEHLQRDNNHTINLDADVFCSDITDLQVTVFPEGKTTGRMMANAAQARSAGAEATLRYRWTGNRWYTNLHIAYGFTDARFVRFFNGIEDYAGRYIPYAPRHTLSARATLQYRFKSTATLCPRSVALTLALTGQGRTYWNEANTQYEPFYAVLNGNVKLAWQHLALTLWTRNLTDTDYRTFYFVSMSNAFFQKARPRQFGISLHYHF